MRSEGSASMDRAIPCPKNSVPQHSLTSSPDWLNVADEGMYEGLKTMQPGGAAPWPAAFEALKIGVERCSVKVTAYSVECDPAQPGSDVMPLSCTAALMMLTSPVFVLFHSFTQVQLVSEASVKNPLHV